jgi:hypothetical protein
VIANRVQVVTLSVPANTTTANPTRLNVSLGWVFLHEVEVMVPPGHNGHSGFCVVSNGLGIVPYTNPATYVIANAETIHFDVDNEQDAFLTVQGYNLDQWTHNFYFRFFYTPITLMTEQLESVAWQAIY